jgi:hypothetical protein
MRDAIVALLQAPGRVRRIDPTTLASVRSCFAERVEAHLGAGANRHPLGFLLVSEPLGGGACLRCHVWPAGWAVPQGQESGQTHDHSYELNSLVLLGSLRQQTFDAEFDVGGDHDVLRVDYTADASEPRSSGLRARLVAETDEIFDAGTAYRLPAARVHRVDAVARPLATIVLAVPVSGAPAPRVFVSSGHRAPGKFVRSPLDSSEIAAARAAISGLRWADKAPQSKA